ncbi:hypothetical protein DLM_2527 [Aquitalea magnusonii]|uniref:Uncharacterized protein n=1 Tax=Aquitalea magnusonii TaxID=332411 RepID=A0A3G9GFI4_9NEIS|nr:hypothetical protein DLM_2527 [Aquitalea magnusonii]
MLSDQPWHSKDYFPVRACSYPFGLAAPYLAFFDVSWR